MKKQVKIKTQNGINYSAAINGIFYELKDDFDFIECDKPDYILFGPYGNDIPKPGPYTRIGYFCENVIPDLNLCEWAFGIPSEKRINNSKYKRIQWHNLDPQNLVKDNWNVEELFASKSKFCNFLYSHSVPYREEFFKQLSKYKKIDAPGKSMNNMQSVEQLYNGDLWSVKRQFLPQYKFTIAFENYVYPGYQTEKLYDAMFAKSLPIYCGDPNIGDIFNTKSFLNTSDYVQINNSPLVKLLENASQWDFVDIRPQFFKSPQHRIRRKLKSIGKKYKMKLQYNKLDFSNLIDQIILLDKDPEAYMSYLKQPWFINNTPPPNASLRSRWIEIFSMINK